MDTLEKNAIVLRQEFEWLERCILERRKEYTEDVVINIENFAPPALLFPDIPYTQFVNRQNFSVEERLMLLLAIASALNPSILDSFAFHKQDGTPCLAPGIRRSQQSGQLIPTGFTVLFLCAGKNEQRRIRCSSLFDAGHIFQQKKIISLSGGLSSEPKYSANLLIHPDWLDLLTTGSYSKPIYGEDFPAEEVYCSMDWEDMVMDELTSTRLRYLMNNITHGELLNDNGLKRLALFYGPAGTGKTTSAAIIGKMCNKPVFKIETSQVVSKYIGETEKNLARVFDRAQDKGWILFFDEADSLFSKRIENPQTSNDKFVNNEINYVLQRLNDFKETVILGTNLPDTLDKAMGRRQYMKVPFYYPDSNQKIKLWEMKKPKVIFYDESVNFDALSAHPNLSPDNIQNIVNFAFIETIAKGMEHITMDLLIEGLKIESEKENKILYDPLRLNMISQPSIQQSITNYKSTVVESSLTKKVESPIINQKMADEVSKVFDYKNISEEKKKKLEENSTIKNLMSNGVTLYIFENEELDIPRIYEELGRKNNQPQFSAMNKDSMEYRQLKEEAYKEHCDKEPEYIIENRKYKMEEQEKVKRYVANLKPLNSKM
jgi:AAA+ superfamily predicted ATPase